MAISLSTRLVNLLSGDIVSVTDAGSQISFTAPSTISTTEGNFLQKGFAPDMPIEIVDGGATTQTAKYVTCSTVTASAITTVESTIVTELANVDTPTLRMANAHNWLTVFKYSVLDVYSSPKPTSADLAETGTKLLSITDGGNTFTAGASTNGLQFEFVSAGKIQILNTQTWQGDGIVTGTAYWARLYANNYITGLDSSNLYSPRLDGRVGDGLDIDITSTSITINVTNTCDQFDITQPTTA